MRKSHKYIVTLSILFAMVFGMSTISCEDEKDFRIIPEERTEFTITAIEPDLSDIGTTVTISGTNFSPVRGNNRVSFNGTAAIVDEANPDGTSLIVTVPEGAMTGPITISIGQVTVEGPNFNVVGAPVITDLNTTGGSPGDTIVITGGNFSEVPTENTVQFGGVDAEVTAASLTELTVIIPEGALSGELTVIVFGQGTSNGFTIAPEVTGFSPEMGIVDTEITITGTNFNPDPENNQVTLNGAIATIVSVSPTELIVQVPAEATSGAIAIEIDGLIGISTTNFTTVPSILSLEPNTGSEGDLVTIDGANFGTVASNLEVRFNTSAVEIVENNFNSISVVVPSGLEIGTANVTVSLAGQTSEAIEFTVVEPIPLTTFGFTSFEEVPTFGLRDDGGAFRYPRPGVPTDPLINRQEIEPDTLSPFVSFSQNIAELGFTASFTNETGDATVVEGERLGVYNNTSINAEPENFGLPFEDGVQGYVTSDLDGTITLRFDTMTNLNANVTRAVLEARVFFRETSWEEGDGIEIFYETADGLGEPIISILAEEVEAIAGQSTLVSVPFPEDRLQEGRLVITFTNGAGNETASLDYVAIKGIP